MEGSSVGGGWALKWFRFESRKSFQFVCGAYFVKFLARLFGVAVVLRSSYAVGRAREPLTGPLFDGEMLVLLSVGVTVAV